MTETGPIVSQSDKQIQDVVDKWTLREGVDGCSDILRDGISYGSLLHDNASFIVGRLNQRDRFMEAAVADAATIASLREQVERQERELDVINSSHRDIGRRYEAAQQQVERLELELMDERRRFIRDNPYASHNAILAEARTAAESRVSVLEGALKRLVDRLLEVHDHPAFRAVWTLNHLHAGSYSGPTYTAELHNAQQALLSLPESEPTYQGYRSKNIGPQYNSDFAPVNAGNTSSDGGGEARSTDQRPAGTGDHLARCESGDATATQYQPSTPAGHSSTPPSGADVERNRERKDAGVAPGPSETLSPSPARVADREAMLRLCSIACVVAFNDDVTTAEFQELGERALEVKLSLLDNGGVTTEGDTFWLIERRVTPPQWMTDGNDLTDDAARARRFASKQQAAEHHRTWDSIWRDQCFVSEHKFVDAAASKGQG